MRKLELRREACFLLLAEMQVDHMLLPSPYGFLGGRSETTGLPAAGAAFRPQGATQILSFRFCGKEYYGKQEKEAEEDRSEVNFGPGVEAVLRRGNLIWEPDLFIQNSFPNFWQFATIQTEDFMII